MTRRSDVSTPHAEPERRGKTARLARRRPPHDLPAPLPLPPAEAVAAGDVPTVRDVARNTVSEQTTQLIWSLPADGWVKDLPTWRAFTGQSREAVRDWGWLAAVHPQDRGYATQLWEHALVTRTPFVAAYRIRRYDGVYRRFSVHGMPLFDAHGRLRRWAGSAIDITERPEPDQERAERLARETAAQEGEVRAQQLIRERAARAETEAANAALWALQALTDTALSHLTLDDLLPRVLERVRQVMAVDNATLLLLEPDGHTLLVRTASGLEEEAAGDRRVPVAQGFAGTIAATRAPLIVNDVTTFPLVSPFLRKHLRSAVGVPLQLGERILGVLHVGTTEYHPFTDHDVQLLQHAADRVALAVERARLYEDAQTAYAAEQRARREAEAARADAEAALAQARSSERHFQRLVEAGIIGIMVGDGVRVLEANDAYLQMLGYTRADLHAGRLTRQLLVPPDREMLAATERAVGEALATGVCQPFEREYLRRDGSHVPVLLGMALLEREPPRFVTFVVDLSERKRLELEAVARARQLEATIEAIPDALLLTDAQGHIVRGNAAYHALYGTAARPEYQTIPVEERARMLQARDLAGRPMPADAMPATRILREGAIPSDAPLELRIRTLDGRELVVSVTGGPVRGPEGQVAGTVMVLRDVTARRRLEQQQRFQASMLERAHDAIFLWELGGRIVYWNQGAELLYGYTAEEALGRVSHELLHTRLPEPAADFEARLARMGEWTGEQTHMTRDSREVQVLSRLQVLTEESEAGGERVYVVETARDITERKRAEEEMRASEEKFRTLADNVPQLVWMARPDGYIFWYNQRWYDYTGTTPDSQEGWGWKSTHDPDVLPQVLEQWRRTLAAGEPFEMVFPLKGADGVFRHFLTRVQPIRDEHDQIVSWFGTNTDIEDQLRLEREREEARASELAAREVAQQLDQFFAMASHDIRTPLTALSGNLDMARIRAQRLAAALQTRDGQDADLVAPLIAALDRADKSKERLLRLVMLLFDVASARAGTLTLNLAPCDLVALVREQVAAHQATAPARAIQLDLPDQPVPVVADADRLAQVLTNYLTNALKYSADDQPVMVRLEVTAGLAVVSVQDHGPGLPWEEQSRVWELYHRAPGVEVQSSSGATSGSLGLGLHTCKRLIELHPGGHVGMESVVGEGSTFWFHLPVPSDNAAEPA